MITVRKRHGTCSNCKTEHKHFTTDESVKCGCGQEVQLVHEPPKPQFAKRKSKPHKAQIKKSQTTYLQFMERHVVFYERVVSDKSKMSVHKAHFAKVQRHLAIALGLKKHLVRCRLISNLMVIYITELDWHARREDLKLTYRDSKDYSHFLRGLLMATQTQ